MKSLLERWGRGADGVVSETGPVRPSDDQSSAGWAVSSKPRFQEAAGRELSGYTPAFWVLAG